MINGFLKYLCSIVLGLVMIPIAVYLVLYLFALLTNDLTWKEMDLNRDSFVSYSEATFLIDVGAREIKVDGETCTDYFAYKDGASLKVVCRQ